MCGAIPPLPNVPAWCGAELKHREDFTFTLPFEIVFYFPRLRIRIDLSMVTVKR
jgi:hypothetical protein